MTCPRCKINTKRIRLGGWRYREPICQVCRRKEDSKHWRLFRLLQILRMY